MFWRCSSPATDPRLPQRAIWRSCCVQRRRSRGRRCERGTCESYVGASVATAGGHVALDF